MPGIPKPSAQWASPTSGNRIAITSEDDFGRWLIAALEWERQRIEKVQSARSSASGGRKQ